MPAKQMAGNVRRPRIKSANCSKIKLNEHLKTQPLSKSADTQNIRKVSDTTNNHFVYRKSYISANSNKEQEEILPAV